MKKSKSLLLTIVSGFLFAVSWPEFGSLNPLLFVAFCPLFYIQDAYQFQEKKGLWISICAFLAFFIWNITTTYWLLFVKGTYTTVFLCGFMPTVFNSLMMVLPFWLFHITKKKFGERVGYMSFIIYWLGMEFFHLQWDLSWPWLEIGNAFSANTAWVQWYEYTGVHGGTLWVLLANILLFKLWRKWKVNKAILKTDWLKVGAIIIGPITLSYLILYSIEEKGKAVEVVVVQPNIDSYSEKFVTEFKDQLNHMLGLADMAKTSKTNLILFPETALQEPSDEYIDEQGYLQLTGFWENNIGNSASVEILRRYLLDTNLDLITGLASDYLYPSDFIRTSTARGEKNFIYDYFNTAMIINSDTIELYHKSKLVPVIERTPFIKVLGPLLGDATITLGESSGSLGSQSFRGVFHCRHSPIIAAPVICYESVYGAYVGDYIKKGANLITIITNDGWWGNTAGYRHHMAYAKLRAIEHRRNVVRSANTGISGFINQKGEITNQSQYGVATALRSSVRLNDKLTFYTRFGDYLGKIAFCLSTLLLIFLMISTKR